MRKIITLVAMLLISVAGVAKSPKVWKTLKSDANFFIVNDSGRNGYYYQKPIAELMGRMAEVISPDRIISLGDIHHFDGVQSVHDPLWMTNYELIFSHPKLMVAWWPVMGNHEHRGDTQAVIDYSNISRRWVMEENFYTRVYKEDGTTVRLVVIDTTPLIDSYRKSQNTYKNVNKSSVEEQLEWLDATLTNAKEDWVIVLGHHPIYADTAKSKHERGDLQRRVDTILRKHENVDFYICGHIHNFQHIRREGCNIDYVVNSAASLSRNVNAVEGTVFCSPEAGFSVLAADKKSINLHMIDRKGRVLHTITRTK